MKQASLLIAVGLWFGLVPLTGSSAQILDFDKLMCRDWLESGDQSAVHTLSWLEGYSDDASAVIDFQRLQSRFKDLVSICEGTPDQSVASAARRAAKIALFKCDERTCKIAVYSSPTGAAKVRVTIGPKQAEIVQGIDFSSDLYCVCKDGDPPNSYNQCILAAASQCRGSRVWPTANY